MNTEILDYIKELSKKEFFVLNVVNTVLSIVIILIASITLKSGNTSLSYAIMFFCATALLATNSYKCFKRSSKNGWVLGFFSVLFFAFAIICLYYTITGM